MSEQEREARMSDEPDVEGHRRRLAHEESEPSKEDAEARRGEDEPDFEAHRKRAG